MRLPKRPVSLPALFTPPAWIGDREGLMNVSEPRDNGSQRPATVSQERAAGSSRRHFDRPGEQPVAKFIQICASQDDLFALDEEGNTYQYNFNEKTWVKLVASRSHEGRA